MRFPSSAFLAAVVCLPAIGGVGLADQHAGDPEGSLACNSMCRWWMALADKPATVPEPSHEAVAGSAPARVASPVHAAAMPSTTTEAAAHHRPVTPPAEAHGAPLRRAAAVVAAAPAHPLPAAAAAEPFAPFAAFPHPAVSLATAETALPLTIVEDRAERAGVALADRRPVPAVVASVEARAAVLTPRRARNGLIAVTLVCALALSLRRTNRARVALPTHRRGDTPLLDAFKARRSTTVP